jgi:hypothetical protein
MTMGGTGVGTAIQTKWSATELAQTPALATTLENWRTGNGSSGRRGEEAGTNHSLGPDDALGVYPPGQQRYPKVPRYPLPNMSEGDRARLHQKGYPYDRGRVQGPRLPSYTL